MLARAGVDPSAQQFRILDAVTAGAEIRPPLLLQRSQANRHEATDLALRSGRAIVSARDLCRAAKAQIDIVQALQRATEKRWHRFIRIRGGSSPAEGLTPVAFTFPTRLVPDARRVSVLGPFNHWNPDAHRLKKTPSGDWSLTIHLPPGHFVYHFDVDGICWLDPNDDGRLQNAWGSEYSVRHVRGTSASAETPRPPRTVAAIQGGAQSYERAPEQTVGRAAVRAAGEIGHFTASLFASSSTISGTPTALFGCRLEERLETTLLHIAGEIDLETARDFEAALRVAIERGRSVVLGLREVRYLDATALRCLIRAHSRVSGDRRQLVLAEPSRAVRKVIEILRFHETVPLFSSLQGALRYLIGIAHDGKESPGHPTRATVLKA